MKRAAVILPYFGKKPKYLGYFLKSIEGVRLDFFWFSDIEIGRAPSNFKQFKMTFEQLRDLISLKLCVQPVISGGWRLCDFKPMYGKIFEDYLEGYDYWGFGDCDLVYGKKVNEFLDRVLPGGYGIISLQEKFLSGPICLLRNTREMRELFQKTENWREVVEYQGSHILNFDECGGNYFEKLVSGEMSLDDCAAQRDNFSSAAWREGVNIFHETCICEDSLKDGAYVRGISGRLFFCGQEILVFHYIRVKVKPWFTYVESEYPNVGDFYIDKTGFYASALAWNFRCLIRPCRILKYYIRRAKTVGLRHCFRRALDLVTNWR